MVQSSQAWEPPVEHSTVLTAFPHRPPGWPLLTPTRRDTKRTKGKTKGRTLRFASPGAHDDAPRRSDARRAAHEGLSRRRALAAPPNLSLRTLSTRRRRSSRDAHAHHAVAELADVSAEGHHRPSLEALHAADAGAETTFAERGSAYHAVGVDLSFHDVGKACMRPDVAALRRRRRRRRLRGRRARGPASRRRAVKAVALDPASSRAAPRDAAVRMDAVGGALWRSWLSARRVLRVFHRQFLDAGRPSRSLLRARHAFLRVATEKRAALTVQCGQRRRLAMRVAEDRRWEHDAAKAAAKVGARVRGMHVRKRRRPKKREAW
ncbi:hypothetical protein JL721_8778 [Aureococcus anophagefferens]|nr:hypothetical protein JL721_8778 [Aureococcus anophagefferens]